MSSSNYFRSWMDKPHMDPNINLLTEEYAKDITEFMTLVQQQQKQICMLRCPCSSCKNNRGLKE